MKKLNIPILTGISLFAVVLLLAINRYLINTTFKYQNRQFQDEITQTVKEILNPIYLTDSRFGQFYDFTDSLSKTFKTKEIYTGLDFINQFKAGSKQFDIYESVLKKELPDKGFSSEFEFAAYFTHLGINENGEPAKTFIFDILLPENQIFGTLDSLNNAYPVHSFVHNQENYLLGMSLYLDVTEQQKIVLQRMWVLLALAGLSILSVISVFLFTFRSLIRQKRLSDMKTDFINNITHEFKTPLATIHLASENLRNPKIQSKPKAVEGLLDVIQRQKNRLQLLLDQVIESRSVSENIQLNKEKTNVHEFLENRIRDFQIKVKDSNVEIKTNFSNQKIELEIDQFHFTTVIFNLLDNAVKYSNDNPKIVVRTKTVGKEFFLEIQDNGIGMDSKLQSHIFSKFYRIPNGNIHNVKGLGLGLFYVKQIVEAHGGDIFVKSKVGKGSCFTIVFQMSRGRL